MFKLIFLTYVVVGSSMGVDPVIDFSDSMVFAMALANMLGQCLLMPGVKRELDRYRPGILSAEIAVTIQPSRPAS